MSTTPTRKPAPLHRQRGIITALAAVILVAAVLYVLTQSLGIIGKTSQSNQTQGESIAAFFLAESGLERGRGLLRAASDRTAASACSDINGFTLDGQTVIVSGVPSGCSGSSGCTTCKLTSTGVVGSSSRTVVSVMSIDPPSGAGGVLQGGMGDHVKALPAIA